MLKKRCFKCFEIWTLTLKYGLKISKVNVQGHMWTFKVRSPWNTAFFNLTQVAFWACQEAENEFKVQCQPSKHCFYRLTSVAFWAGLKAQNEFKVRCENLIHCFDLILRLLIRRKFELRKIEESKFHVLAFHFELNSYLLTSSKCDLEEADKAKIHVLSSHFELIFCLLTSPKCDFRKVEKAVFQVLWNLTFDLSPWPWTLTFEIFNPYFKVKGQSSNSKTPETPLFKLTQVAGFSRAGIALWTHFLPLD